MAYDLNHKSNKYASHYTEQDVIDFEKYIETGLSELEINNPEGRTLLLNMYANPVQNKGKYEQTAEAKN